MRRARRASLNQFSAKDADAYPKVMARLQRQANALGVYAHAHAAAARSDGQ